MERIPLVSIRNGVLLDGLEGNKLSIEELFARVAKDAMLYVLDYDGIDHNNPNLELYQKLSASLILWIDDGPRRIDDVMDTIMAGATNLTVRPDHWPDVSLEDIFELTDGEVFYAVTPQQTMQRSPSLVSSSGVGVIVFPNEHQINQDFTAASYLKELGMKYKLYLYSTEGKNLSGWEEQGLTGLVVDVRTIGGHP
jgi:hypothetical protein